MSIVDFTEEQLSSTLIEVYSCAIENLAKRGWIQGAGQNSRGICLSYAINISCSQHRTKYCSRHGISASQRAPVTALHAAAFYYIRKFILKSATIPHWNDSVCKTKEQAIEALNDAILALQQRKHTRQL